MSVRSVLIPGNVMYHNPNEHKYNMRNKILGVLLMSIFPLTFSIFFSVMIWIVGGFIGLFTFWGAIVAAIIMAVAFIKGHDLYVSK